MVLATDDLLATSRVEGVARAAGLELDIVPLRALGSTVGSVTIDLLIVDLDAGGAAAIAELTEAIELSGPIGGRVIGYFSHVDTPLRAAAEAAGIEAWPRGRFWRELGMLLKTVANS